MGASHRATFIDRKPALPYFGENKTPSRSNTLFLLVWSPLAPPEFFQSHCSGSTASSESSRLGSVHPSVGAPGMVHDTPHGGHRGSAIPHWTSRAFSAIILLQRSLRPTKRLQTTIQISPCPSSHLISFLCTVTFYCLIVRVIHIFESQKMQKNAHLPVLMDTLLYGRRRPALRIR